MVNPVSIWIKRFIDTEYITGNKVYEVDDESNYLSFIQSTDSDHQGFQIIRREGDTSGFTIAEDAGD